MGTVTGRSANLLYRARAYTSFIVLCAPRTGSSHLVSLLSSHPNVRVFGEVLGGPYLRDNPRLRRAPVPLLRHELFRGYPGGVRAVGFKLFYHHGADDPDLRVFPAAERRRIQGVWRYLAGKQELRVLHLKRRNVLRSVVSAAVASESGEWVRHRWAPPPTKDRQVTLPPEELQRHLEEQRRSSERCEGLFRGHACLALYYEDLVADAEAQMRAVGRFLGLPGRRLTSITQRQNPHPLRQMLANYEQVRDRLRGTEWEAMLDE